MEVLSVVAGLPPVARDLVLGHWPETDVEGMRRFGDAYSNACEDLRAYADEYEAASTSTEDALRGATRDGLAGRHYEIGSAIRAKAALCESLGQQCHDMADMAVQTQHLIAMTGVVFALQLAYDMAMFYAGGGVKALGDRLAAQQAMRIAGMRFATGAADKVAAGAARRAALYGAARAAGIGAVSGMAISVGAQIWDIESGVRDGFDGSAFLEMTLGGLLGGAAGAEVGRRLAPHLFGRLLPAVRSSHGALIGRHVGATMLLGGAGGLAGGIAGAAPVVALRIGEIHTLSDLFKIVRESAITGFGGGFVGAAGSGLRTHSSGRSSLPRSRELDALVARQGNFSTRMNQLLASDRPPSIEYLAESPVAGGGRQRSVYRLTFHDGTQVLQERVPNPTEAYERFFTTLIGDAVGALVPAVHLAGDVVYTEVIPGASGADVVVREPGAGHRLAATPSGMRLGVLDALMDPGLRRRAPDEWVLDRTGRVWSVGPGHWAGPTEGRQPSVFAEQFVERDMQGGLRWRNHDLTRSEIAQIRARVELLRPIFEGAGYRSWHESMMQHLDSLDRTAADPAVPEPVTTSQISPVIDSAAGATTGYTTPSADVGAHVWAEMSPPIDAGHRFSGGETRGANAVRMQLGEGPPVRVVPGKTVIVGTSDTSPFAAQLRGQADVVEEHARAGTDRAGRVWIRDDGDGGGVWVNGEKLPLHEPRTVSEGDEVALGPDFRATIKMEPIDDSRLPRAQISLGPDETPITLAPGEQVHVDPGDRAHAGIESGQDIADGTPGQMGGRAHKATGNEPESPVIVGRDFDGRVWVHDPAADSGSPSRVTIGDESVGAGRHYVEPGETVSMGDKSGRLDVDFFRQAVRIRVYNDSDWLSMLPGDNLRVGGARFVTVDAYGRVWIHDPESEGIRVNDEWVSPGRGRILESGDIVQYGTVRHTIEFLPMDVRADVGPIQVKLGSGADALRMRLDPGASVEVGANALSPFGPQLRGSDGVHDRHAVINYDNEGRLRVRSTGDPAEVRINGEMIPVGQWVPLAEGVELGLGTDFVATVSANPVEGPRLPPAEIFFESGWKSVELAPGEHLRIDQRSNFKRSDAAPQREVMVGRDFDGRVWVRGPEENSGIRVSVDGEEVRAGEKRYMEPDTDVDFDGRTGRLRVEGEGRPVQLRLSDDATAPLLTLSRRDEVKLGSGPESPLAQEMAARGLAAHHATIYRDTLGNLWIRDEGSEAGTWVEGKKLGPGESVMLAEGAPLRLGAWVGAAQFSGGPPSVGDPLNVKLDSGEGRLLLDLPRGGPGVVLGRGQYAELPPMGPGVRDRVSDAHAIVGVHPSGGLWIAPHSAADAPTYVNGTAIHSGEKTRLYPGDRVGIGEAGEFTVVYRSPDGGAVIDLVDLTPATVKALRQLAAVPEHVYVRVAEFLNSERSGKIIIGERSLEELRSRVRNEPIASGDGSWERYAGMYSPAERRLFIDSGANLDIGHGSVIWHEFGHAADHAYGDSGRRLHQEAEWQNLHAQVIGDFEAQPSWDTYFSTPVEFFAEAFRAWVGGPEQMIRFADYDQANAARLTSYFDRTLR